VANCRRATDLLIAHKVDYILIDGEDPNSTSRRDELFSISGVRGNYPQFFIITEHPESLTFRQSFTTAFLGGWEKIEQLNEARDIDKATRLANPEIETLDMLLDIVKLK
ncbi:hypothetical protein ScalyP_jg450, partial [Parmales sp. scaly parma]